MKKLGVYLLVSIFALAAVSEANAQSLRKARKSVEKNKLEDAKKEAEKIIAKNPDEAEAYFILGQVMGREGDVTRMKELFAKTQSMTIEFNGRINVETTLVGNLNYTEGQKNLEEGVAEKDEEKASVHYRDAVRRFEASLQIDGEDRQTKQSLGHAYFLLDENEKAENLYKEVLAADPKNKIILRNLGDINFQRGYENEDLESHKASLKYYGDLVTNYPEERPKVMRQMAASQETLGNDEEAIKLYEEIMLENKDDTELATRIAVLKLNIGDAAAAMADFKEIVAKDPDNVQVLTMVAFKSFYEFWDLSKGETTITNEQWNSILPYMVKLSKLTPKDPLVWDSLVKIYTKMGDEKKAEAAFQEFLKVKGTEGKEAA